MHVKIGIYNLCYTDSAYLPPYAGQHDTDTGVGYVSDLACAGSDARTRTQDDKYSKKKLVKPQNKDGGR